jgi:26S proteasome regulatory subunit T5
MADTMEVEKPKTLEEALQEEEIDPEILNSSVDDITARTRALDREIQILRHEQNRLHHEQAGLKEKIKENNEKIKLNKQLPYLVANVVEVCIALQLLHTAPHPRVA